MPCVSFDDDEETRDQMLDRVVPPAMLCAFIQLLTPRQLRTVLSRIDWEKAGITEPMVMEWWRMHQTRDALRQQEARERAEQEVRRRSALLKLSPEERKALGLGDG